MKKLFDARVFMVVGLILIAALSRLVEHPANVSPIMAIAIFGGAFLSDKRIAFILPISAMLISDFIIGFYTISIFVYLGFALGILIGFLLKNRIKVVNIVIASIFSSVLFFIVTNFGSWLTDPMYQPLTIESLTRCYTLAIPFFRNSLIGVLAYSAVLFGAFSLAERYVPILSTIKK